MTPGSYEAYCLDQAVWYVGSTITSELEKAGQGKKSKGQAKAEAARKRVLNKFLGGDTQETKMYADPADFMNQE